MNEQNNAEFVNVGMEQPAEVERHDDVVIKVDGPSNGKGWKIAAICALVAVVGLGAGLVFVLMSSNDSSKKVDDVQAQLDARTEELNKFKEVTGVESATDFVASNVDVDLTKLYSVVPKTAGNTVMFNLNGGYLKENGKYQVALLGVGEYTAEGVAIPSGYAGYFYRALPDGEWVMSKYTGNAQAKCADLTEDDKKAFEGLLECAE